MADAKSVLKMIKDKEVKFVDLRFTDPRGKWQHVTFDLSLIDEDAFTRLLTDALRQSGPVRAVMADLVAGTQSYRGLKARLAKTLELRLAWALVTCSYTRPAHAPSRQAGVRSHGVRLDRQKIIPIPRAVVCGRTRPPLVAMTRSSGYGYRVSAIRRSLTSGP